MAKECEGGSTAWMASTDAAGGTVVHDDRLAHGPKSAPQASVARGAKRGAALVDVTGAVRQKAAGDDRFIRECRGDAKQNIAGARTTAATAAAPVSSQDAVETRSGPGGSRRFDQSFLQIAFSDEAHHERPRSGCAAPNRVARDTRHFRIGDARGHGLGRQSVAGRFPASPNPHLDGRGSPGARRAGRLMASQIRFHA